MDKARRKTRKPGVPSVSEKIVEAINPINQNSGPTVFVQERANEISQRNDEHRNFSITFDDVDSAILYHLEHNIAPYVMIDGQRNLVPVMYATPEKWVSAQREGYLRDKDGRIIFPVIAIRRETMDKVRDLGNKLDANRVHNYHVFEKKYTRKNTYDAFSVLTNRMPVKEYTVFPVPDYYTINYSCAVYASKTADLNKILEPILYSSNSYWGNKRSNIFMANINSVPVTYELNVDNDKKVYSIFNFTVNATILPNDAFKKLGSQDKFFSKGQVVFKTEAVGGGVETLNYVANKAKDPDVPKNIFPERLIQYNLTVGNEVSEYIDANKEITSMPSDVFSDRVYFRNHEILQAPEALPPTSKSDFYVFINGQYVPQEYVLTISEVGNDILVVFDVNNMGYQLNSTTHSVTLKGKIA